MLPVIVIIGRPNVGKSTFFNYLTKSKAALVADVPGVTRDRQYGEGKISDRRFIVVDTGGIEDVNKSDMSALTEQQVQQAIAESDVVLLVVNAQEGLTVADEKIASKLRSIQSKLYVVVNKADNVDVDLARSEFFQLGLGEPKVISAKRGRGVNAAMEDILAKFPLPEVEESAIQGIKIAVVGRPNVGKSTLVNTMFGEDRVIVSDQPGTTRDSIFVPYQRRGKDYVLIDTAGIRRRAKIHDMIEKFSVIKTLQSIEAADVILMVMNAREDISDQDLRLLGWVLESGKAVIMVINQWDDLEDAQRQEVKSTMDRRLNFMDFARRYFISALHGTGVGDLYRAIHEAYDSANADLSTSQLTEALEHAVHEHQPPLSQGRRIKLRYAHLGGHNPMVIIIHGKQVDAVPHSYERYLVNYFRKRFNLIGVPVQIKFKNDPNPYV